MRTPGNRRFLRTRHNEICDAVEADNLVRARELLRTMPAQYRAAIALLHFAAAFEVEEAQA